MLTSAARSIVLDSCRCGLPSAQLQQKGTVGPWNYHLDLAPVNGTPPTAHVIGTGRTNKAGMLTIRGTLADGEIAGACPALLSFPPAPYIGNSRSLTGADVWLVPDDCIWSDGGPSLTRCRL